MCRRTVREEVVPVLGAVRLADLLHLPDKAPDWQVVVEHLEVVILPHRLRGLGFVLVAG